MEVKLRFLILKLSVEIVVDIKCMECGKMVVEVRKSRVSRVRNAGKFIFSGFEASNWVGSRFGLLAGRALHCV